MLRIGWEQSQNMIPITNIEDFIERLPIHFHPHMEFEATSRTVLRASDNNARWNTENQKVRAACKSPDHAQSFFARSLAKQVRDFAFKRTSDESVKPVLLSDSPKRRFRREDHYRSFKV